MGICAKCGLAIKRYERWAEFRYRSGLKRIEHVPMCPDPAPEAHLDLKP